MIENHIYQSTEYDSDLDSEDNMDFVAAGDNADNHYAECMKIPTKISVATPEQLQKRKEVYEKWLQDVQ